MRSATYNIYTAECRMPRRFGRARAKRSRTRAEGRYIFCEVRKHGLRAMVGLEGVLFLTTIHLRIGRGSHRKRKAGLTNMLASWQPSCRRSYIRFMGEVGIADQYNGACAILHKSKVCPAQVLKCSLASRV